VLAIHCDFADCDSWVKAGYDLPNGFVTVVHTFGGEAIGHYCSVDHMLYALAASTAEVPGA